MSKNRKVRIYWEVPAQEGSFVMTLPEDWDELDDESKNVQIQYFVDDHITFHADLEEPAYSFKQEDILLLILFVLLVGLLIIVSL